MEQVALNLACGSRTSDRCVNIDWSIYLRLKRFPGAKYAMRVFLDPTRRAKYEAISGTTLVHDLRKGIPYPDCSVDVVYHSHFLEHLERQAAVRFLKEALRVLKCGGIHRIVVPDFEKLCQSYLAHLSQCETDPLSVPAHENYIEAIVGQMVREEAVGTSLQSGFRRFFENLLLGDARTRGEVHRWMYDRVSLVCLLERAGFRDIRVCSHSKSEIPNWDDIGLDTNEDGQEYMHGSCYIECRK